MAFDNPQNNSAGQIFGSMLGSSQGLPSFLGSQQLSGIGSAVGAGQNVQNSMMGQNAANQSAAGNVMQLQAGLDMNRNNNSAGFAKSLLMRPILASLVASLGSNLSGGGLQGFASTNSPQAASLPAGAAGTPAGRPGFGQIASTAMSDPWAPVASANSQFGSNINPLAFEESPVDALRREQQTNASLGKQMPYGKPNPGVVNLKGFF